MFIACSPVLLMSASTDFALSRFMVVTTVLFEQAVSMTASSAPSLRRRCVHLSLLLAAWCSFACFMRLSVHMVMAGIFWPGFASECSRMSTFHWPLSMLFSMRGMGKSSAATATANGSAQTAAMMIRMAPPPLWESASLAGKQGQSLFFPAVELLFGEVLAEPLVRGARVRLHALEARDARGERREVAVRLARHALPGEHLEELVHREPARVAGRALGRQDVVRPGRLVAEGDGGFR